MGIDAPAMLWLQTVALGMLALVHVFAGRLRGLQTRSGKRWLSAAGGVSIAYVFVHLLPELQRTQQHLGELSLPGFLQHHAYLVALLGLLCWYGLERVVRCSGPTPQRQDGMAGERGETTAPAAVFWLHVASFCTYNALIGYLLVQRGGDSARALAIFALAMALHFVVNDSALRREHKETYRRAGRWLLAAAVLLGGILGMSLELSQATVGVLFAFLAGGIILNVLKEELPKERDSRFLAFVGGALAYAVLLLFD